MALKPLSFEPLRKGAFVFASGWAVDSRFWEPLIAVLRQGRYAGLLDDEGDRAYIGISHSFGLHALAGMRGLKAVIAFCPFYRLCRIGDGNPFDTHALHPAVITKMAAVLERDPQRCIDDFYHRAGLSRDMMPDVSDPEVLADLKTGLNALKSARIDPLSGGLLRVAAATDDLIVPEALVRDQFAHIPVTWVRGAGHALGYTQAAACAVLIESVINELMQA